MDIGSYLARNYQWPGCWTLVVDVYREQLGLQVFNYEPEQDTSLAIARKFREELHRGEHQFTHINGPEDYCLVIFTRPGNHCGVYYDGKVLHAGKDGVFWQDLYSLKDQYGKTEFLAYGKD